METEEVKMSEKESIELIASMINQAKNRVGETGKLYILWGWLILICCIIQFIGLHFFQYEKSYYVWFLTWLLLIYQIFFLSKERKNRKVRTYTGEINGFVWLVFFICMMLVTFIGSYLKKYEMIYPVLLVLYGMPTFLSGIILKFKPLIIGGICCWALSTFSVFISGDYQLLLVSAAVIAAWIIPGHILQQNFKKGI
ncbi:MAG: hypothetical protein ABI237_08895 [Ginsengibacter sp.]